ncbi:MAG: glucosyl-3-phosphoglycerate synthase [Acidimicrobiales bacterium]
MTGDVRTFHHTQFPIDALLAAKAGRSVTVCVPARDEETTVAGVVDAVRRSHLGVAGGSGLVDEVLVVDDGSADSTADVASAAGARVVRLARSGGKGTAMGAGLAAAEGDFLVYLDADVENTTGSFVSGLLGPLLAEDDVALVKAFYERPLGGAPSGGGRVTELTARPVIELLFPELAAVRQPLAGETAAPRWALEKLDLEPGYGVELGLLIDVAVRFGVPSIAQVDLGTRAHRNRSLDELRPQAVEVLRAGLARARPGPGPG